VTLGDALRTAMVRFDKAGLHFGHGSDNSYDEAAFLILHTLNLPLDALEPHLNRRLTSDEISRVLAVLDRRIGERIPAAYLTLEARLAGFKFYVDERVIIPRSHIAELLLEQLSPWIVEPQKIAAALDLCTGSGCLAIIMAHVFPNAKIDASDISRPALEVARRNVADYGLQQRIEVIESDMFDALRARHYDLIISNPPYVRRQSMQTLPEEYRHEPGTALDGGVDGLDFVRRILRASAAYLSDRGVLVVETGGDRGGVESAFPGVDFVWLETSGNGSVFLLTREQLANGAW
jgi:ribosomal protein L3 glutamine methyltransferase